MKKTLLLALTLLLGASLGLDASTLWSGSKDMGTAWGSNDNVQIPASQFASATTGTRFTARYSQNSGPAYFQIQFSEGAKWNKLAIDGANQYGSIDLPAGSSEYSFTLSASDLAAVKAGGMAIQGYGITLTALDASDDSGSSSQPSQPSSSETTLWSGSQDMGTAWGSNDNVQIPASQFASATTDTRFTARYTQNSGPAYFQIQFSEGANWTKLAIDGANQYGSIDLPAGSSEFSFTLSASDLAAVKAGGMAIQGYGITLTALTMSGTSGSQGGDTPSQPSQPSSSVLWSGSKDMGTAWGANDNIVIPASQFAGCSASSEFTLKYTQNAGPAYFQAQFSEAGGWQKLAITGANSYGSIDLQAGSSSFSFRLSASDIAAVQSAGMAIQGYGITITELSVVNSGSSSSTDTPSQPSGSASGGFSIQGNKLIDAKGYEFVMRGANYSYAWQKGNQGSVIPAAARQKCNTLRIQLGDGCTEDSSRRFARCSVDEVRQLIQLCEANKIIAVFNTHNETGLTSLSSLRFAADYWKQPAMVQLLNEHKSTVILNISNEWDGDWESNNWRQGYCEVIPALRAAGVENNIMVDASGWGQNAQCIVEAGTAVLNSDPQRNITFAIHFYDYAAPASNPSKCQNSWRSALNAVQAPVIVGEFAYRSNGKDISYQAILDFGQQNQAGWLAWSWTGNDDSELDMFSSYNDSSIKTNGDKLINGSNGIKATAKLCTVYDDRYSAIDRIDSDSPSDSYILQTTYFNLAGQPVSDPSNGIFIARSLYSDGTVSTSKVTF